MKSVSRLNKVQLKEEIIKRRIKIRKFQGEAIYQCLPGKIPADHMSRNANDKIWDVILFIGLHDSSAVPLASSDIFLGTELPKRTVIRIIDKLETLNVVKKTTDTQDRRVTRVQFTPVFTRLFDRHLEECFGQQLELFRGFL